VIPSTSSFSFPGGIEKRGCVTKAKDPPTSTKTAGGEN
ncbi:unnamed protein product, partial [Acidithrix sp. C25]